MKFPDVLIAALLKANSLVFFTGAGISAESGISTFRGKGGIWNKMKPEELANFDAFMKKPDLVWEWYQYRRKIINETGPNPAHTAIAEFEKYYSDVSVVTQNVDNLHNRAGSKNVFELHGNIEKNYCVDCETHYSSPEITFSEKVPKCEKCGGLIRPDIVWFGEMLPQDVFINGDKAAARCDICFIIGTSAVVYPAAHIPITARDKGAYLVEINIEESNISDKVNCFLKGKAGVILPALLNEIMNKIKPQ
ncbi:MAG: NAD-dependent deacylase [Melioribacteraceae bacterium]|nr:NAD-dependent deacylase [Melioribacteraceae bacterium]